MSPPDDDRAQDVVRARRFEVVDADGNLRATLGDVASPDPHHAAVGLVIMTATGERRATIAAARDGTSVLLELGGNVLVNIGVHELTSDAVDSRAFLYLCDVDGRPVAGWWVTDDGRLVEERFL